MLSLDKSKYKLSKIPLMLNALGGCSDGKYSYNHNKTHLLLAQCDNDPPRRPYPNIKHTDIKKSIVKINNYYILDLYNLALRINPDMDIDIYNYLLKKTYKSWAWNDTGLIIIEIDT